VDNVADPDITEFVPAHVWVAEKGGQAFQTMGQFDWFRRRHRAELVASGQLIAGGGRRADLCGPHLGRVIHKIMSGRNDSGPGGDAQSAS
jgi:hypothetical protein